MDRSFANLDETVEIKFFGKSALALYRIGTCCWRSNSARAMVETVDEVPLISEPDEERNRLDHCKELGFSPIIEVDKIDPEI